MGTHFKISPHRHLFRKFCAIHLRETWRKWEYVFQIIFNKIKKPLVQEVLKFCPAHSRETQYREVGEGGGGIPGKVYSKEEEGLF
jgi:hypothetical protein